MTAPGTVQVVRASHFSFAIDTSGVRKVFAGMPRVAYFWLHDYLFRSFHRHRMRWLAVKGPKFGRAGGIQVWQINDGPKVPGPKDVTYSLTPEARRAGSRELAETYLDRLVAEAFTGNNVLPVHEFGTDIQSPGYMTVKVKGTRGSPEQWREAHPGKRLVLRPSKGKNSNLLLYEIGRAKQGRGRPRKGAPPPAEKLKLRYVLTKRVDMKATLHMYDTWDVLRGDRDDLWSEIADKMLRDFDRDDPRDR